MKFNNIKTLNKEDFTDAPKWFTEQFLPVFNDLITNTNNTLTKLDFENNFRTQTFEVVIKNGEPLSLTYNLKTKPTRVWLDYAENAVISGFSWDFKGNDSVEVKINMDKAEVRAKITLIV